MDLLAELNPEQGAAVVHRGGPLLVLAGAGSGKTRVIVRRIAHLIESGTPAWSILAVTFTNKAAGELRERLAALCGEGAARAWVSTFHSTGASILRREATALGLTPAFTIYDDDDQLALAKRVLREANREADSSAARDLLSSIDRLKNGVALEEAGGVPDPSRELHARYERALRAANAVDFGDLLALPVRLFETHPDILDRYRRRFSHVLVDEFQDTNLVQYRLLKLLCPTGQGFVAVGDDDQSIYRWRGADVRNILGFEADFPGAAVVKLTRNYRSDGNILAAAQAVIAENPHRHEKLLWTQRPPGALLTLLCAQDERDEADRVAAIFCGLREEGTPLGEMAIFYRINAQSRVVEEAMRLARLPYVIVRGRSFYERAEVKDAVAYLRLMVNPRSDVDLARVINVPARGIGDTTVERLSRHALARGLCLFDALAGPELQAVEGLNAGARGRLEGFRKLLEALVEIGRDGSAGRSAEAAIGRSGLLSRLETDPDATDRAENLREFIHAAAEMDARWEREEAAAARPEPSKAEDRAPDEPQPESSGGALLCFLEEVALLGDADGKGGQDHVSLMTLHAAKGLEFDAVAIVGLEDGIFPHSRALGYSAAPEEMAEERRLCYVGFTRARHRLILACARARALFGELRFNPPSRFLAAVPAELLDQPVQPARASGPSIDHSFDQSYRPSSRPQSFRGSRRAAAPSRAPAGNTPALRPSRAGGATGLQVRHAVFGIGRVLTADGDGPDAKLTVRFPSVGDKRIVARFVTPV